MHFLDLIMWIVIGLIIGFLLDVISEGEWTHELGALVGMFVLIVYSIIYLILFAFWPDWNWVDFDYPSAKEFFSFFKW